MRAKWRARGAKLARDIDGQAGQYQWCRLRESNTHVPRYEGGALPGSAKPAKNKKMVSGPHSAKGSDLATGTTAPSRARCRWPILDVHNVKQQTQNFYVRRSVELRRRIPNARHCHARRFTQRALLFVATDATHARPDADVASVRVAKAFDLVIYFGPSGPSCLLAEGFGPPPVSPVFSTRIRVGSEMRNRRSSHTRSRNRSTDHSVARWRRGARYMCQCGASGSSWCR